MSSQGLLGGPVFADSDTLSLSAGRFGLHASIRDLCTRTSEYVKSTTHSGSHSLLIPASPSDLEIATFIALMLERRYGFECARVGEVYSVLSTEQQLSGLVSIVMRFSRDTGCKALEVVTYIKLYVPNTCAILVDESPVHPNEERAIRRAGARYLRELRVEP